MRGPRAKRGGSVEPEPPRFVTPSRDAPRPGWRGTRRATFGYGTGAHQGPVAARARGRMTRDATHAGGRGAPPPGAVSRRAGVRGLGGAGVAAALAIADRSRAIAAEA